VCSRTVPRRMAKVLVCPYPTRTSLKVLRVFVDGEERDIRSRTWSIVAARITAARESLRSAERGSSHDGVW
jgi:hypothetical protein